jgi:tRNA threonylcarbamoyladenosine biosynthesis protein TsaE
MDYISKNTEDTKELARIVSSKTKPNNVIALYGDLGAGKTTFVRYLTEILKIPSRVQSPTFVLVRKYAGGTGTIKTINHIDLYRLTGETEVEDLGLEDLINEPNTITIIEWPELIESKLPKNTIRVRFEIISENERRMDVQNLN